MPKLVSETLYNYLKENDNYEETSWSKNINGKDIKITINDIQSYLKKKKVPITEIKVDAIKDMCIHKDKKDKATITRSQKSDLSYPIIIAKRKDKYVMILDGHHRLKKAIDNNIEKIRAMVLDLNTAPNNYIHMFT